MPIFAFGSNGSGQLGLGHLEDVSKPEEVVELSGFADETPKLISAGGNHSLILFESGRFATAGGVSGFAQSQSITDIKLCSATWDASILCTASDEILTFGNGDKGELGRGQDVTQCSSKESQLDISSLIPAGVEIVDLASGLYHTVAVLSNGEVIGWGNGRKGQLGQPAEIVWTPRKFRGLPFRVKRAVCGSTFTFLVGDPVEGQCLVLGQDKYGVISSAPISIPGWKDIGASWGSIFVLFDDGRLLSWGRHDHGQLGPQNMTDIARIAIGSEHVLALSEKSELLAWGWGEHGNCGPNIDNAGDVWHPEEIPLPDGVTKITGVGAGCATSWFWT